MTKEKAKELGERLAQAIYDRDAWIHEGCPYTAERGDLAGAFAAIFLAFAEDFHQ